MEYTTTPKRLEFMQLMRRWFTVRIIHQAQNFDPAKRRQYIAEVCKLHGVTIHMPPWMGKPKQRSAWVLATVEEHTKLFERIGIFKDLGPKERKEIAQELDEEEYHCGEDIIVQGDFGETFYVLEQGKCD